jgi:hypothetical protein
MDSNISSLLATLAQSSAAVVAIVGGFLVSRLVALSSEREGVRRQLAGAKDELKHVRRDYAAAHEYRLSNSLGTFYDWVIDDLVKAGERFDHATLLESIPRGSSVEEMEPYLNELRERVTAAAAVVRGKIQSDDNSRLKFEDLVARGLQVDDRDRHMTELIVDQIASEELPDPPTRGIFGLGFDSPDLRIAGLRDNASRITEMRRLDESIREEQDLQGRLAILEANERRLDEELVKIGRPVGVTSAIIILAVYSLIGILLPVVVMAMNPAKLAGAIVASLVVLFGAGLFAVLAYIFWYARTLDD